MRQLIICLHLFAFGSLMSHAQQLPGYRLVWSDEFAYNGLPDSSKWSYDVGGNGWGNNEWQYYTWAKKKNARVENGRLIIEAHRETIGTNAYSSARLVTRGKGDWQYGKILVKAKLPSGRGTWPAIWMLGSTKPLRWPDDGEIDVMEHVGYNQNYIHASVHTKKYNHIVGTQKTDTVIVPDCSDSFHVYGVEWSADNVQISIDGIIYFTFKNEKSGYDAWPFDNKLYLILNLAVGGNWGGAQGVDESIWPRRMEVDFVRVYQR